MPAAVFIWMVEATGESSSIADREGISERVETRRVSHLSSRVFSCVREERERLGPCAVKGRKSAEPQRASWKPAEKEGAAWTRSRATEVDDVVRQPRTRSEHPERAL